MKKLMLVTVAVLLLVSLSVSASAGSRISKYATIKHMNEEVVDGVMTGRLIQVGSSSRAVASYQYDAPSLKAYPEGQFGESASISISNLTSSTIYFSLNAQYRQCAYVYMGGFTSMANPVVYGGWSCTVAR